MKKYALLLSLCLASPIFAQTPAERTETFLQDVNKDSTKALNKLIDGSMLADPKYSDMVATLKTQIPNLMQLSGQLTNPKAEKISERDTSSSTKELVYLQTYDRSPTTWYFQFYKPKDKWQLYSIYFLSSFPPSTKD